MRPTTDVSYSGIVMRHKYQEGNVQSFERSCVVIVDLCTIFSCSVCRDFNLMLSRYAYF